MNLYTLKKKFDFIPEPLYQKLDKRTREKLLTFRRKGHNLNQKTKRIENLQKKIDDERELLREMKLVIIQHQEYLNVKFQKRF